MPGEGVNVLVRGHDADAVVVAVGDVKIAGGIEGHAGGFRQVGVDGRAAVSVEGRDIIPGNRRNDAARVHLADHTVSGIGDIHVARAIEGDSIGLVQRSAGGFAAVSGIDFGRAGAGHGGDDTARGNLADPVVVLVDDIDVVAGIHPEAGRRVEFGADGLPAIPGETRRRRRRCHAGDERNVVRLGTGKSGQQDDPSCDTSADCAIPAADSIFRPVVIMTRHDCLNSFRSPIPVSKHP